MGAGMTLEKRLMKLEAATVARPDPEADAAVAELVATLNRLAARKAAGDVTADAELQASVELAPTGQRMTVMDARSMVRTLNSNFAEKYGNGRRHLSVWP